MMTQPQNETARTVNARQQGRLGYGKPTYVRGHHARGWGVQPSGVKAGRVKQITSQVSQHVLCRPCWPPPTASCVPAPRMAVRLYTCAAVPQCTAGTRLTVLLPGLWGNGMRT